MAAPNHLAQRSPDAAYDFIAQPVEHHSTLGIDSPGLISVGSIWTGRIFPLALYFFDASYHGVH
jgi:hypothetical protein